MIYSAFGLTVAASSAVPGLDRSPVRGADRRADLAGWPLARHPRSHGVLCYTGDVENGKTPGLRVWNVAGRYFRFRYDDGVEFVVDRRGNRGVGQMARHLDARRRRDVPPRPGAGIPSAASRRCVSSRERRRHRGSRGPLAGPPEAGKSTAAAAFWQMGHAILTDDVAPIVDSDGRPVRAARVSATSAVAGLGRASLRIRRRPALD